MYELPNSVINSLPIPIAIPIKTKFEQYSLLYTRFDPPQNSPPSMWKMRLNNRVGVTPTNDKKNSALSNPVIDKKNGIVSNLKDAAPFVVGGRNPI